MTIDSYGGQPDIVATREEIYRVALEIKLAAVELSAFGPIETLLADPLHQLQFRLSSVNVLAKLERLHGSCLIAAEQYFSTEAQISARFEVVFVPQLAQLVSSLAVGLGWKLDQNVSAIKSSELRAKSPESITDMLDRLWQVSNKPDPTVGIDFFEKSGQPRTVLVYVPGTQTLGLGEGENPLDMQSNILAMAGSGNASSERAVLEAMRQAGVTESDEVIFIGHSQGGLLAANLTQNPAGYIAAGLITIGAPLAQIKLTSVPVMAIEHVNDPVPNVSGRVNPIQKNWVTIQRKALASESEAPMHSHSLKSYRNTTEQVDSSKRAGVSNIREELLSKIRGSKFGTALDFVISREF